MTCVTAKMQSLKFMRGLEVTWCDIFLNEVILLDTSICSKKDFLPEFQFRLCNRR